MLSMFPSTTPRSCTGRRSLCRRTTRLSWWRLESLLERVLSSVQHSAAVALSAAALVAAWAGVSARGDVTGEAGAVEEISTTTTTPTSPTTPTTATATTITGIETTTTETGTTTTATGITPSP